MKAFNLGLDVAYVVARTVSGGRAEGLASCLGTSHGELAHVLARTFGESVIIAESAMTINLLKRFQKILPKV